MKLNELKKLIKEQIALLLEYEVYVDEKGYAHDDEGNKWFVGEDYAGGTYGLHDLPPRRSEPRSKRSKYDRGVDW